MSVRQDARRAAVEPGPGSPAPRVLRAIAGIGVAVVAAVFLTGCTTSGARPSPAVVACAAKQLRARVAGDQHDNTSVYRSLALVNVGAACVLGGKPSVSLLEADSARTRAGGYFPYDADGHHRVPHDLVLTHGARATVRVTLALAGTTKCDQDRVEAFALHLGGAMSGTVRVPAVDERLVVCDDGDRDVLDFSPLLPG